MRAEDLPSFKNLPKVEGMPHGCAWGIWDKNGEKDQLGSLNLLTPEIVSEAGREIKTGDRCALKYMASGMLCNDIAGVFNSLLVLLRAVRHVRLLIISSR
jgi:hypothetical protein